MTETADVVVIGGGIMGASTAYHLAKAGCKKVVLLEAAEMFGLGSTGLNAGGVRHQFSSRVNIELSKLSFAMMERFDNEMGQQIGLRRCGYLFLMDKEADLARARADVALQRSLGVPSKVVSVDDILRLAPEVNLEGIIGGTWCDRDGLVDPHGLVQGYIANARRLGVSMHTQAFVRQIQRVGALRRITAGDVSVEALTVVIAAGPWSAEVGKLAGVALPIQPIRRQIAVTGPLPDLRTNFPFVIDFTQALYFHREGPGILTGMSNRSEKPGVETNVDIFWRDHHLERAMRRLPLLERAELAAEWAGLYEVTPDDQPILGKLDDGLYVCAGFSGHGLMHGPAAGLLMAEEILDGKAKTIDIEPLRFERFSRPSLIGSSKEFAVV